MWRIKFEMLSDDKKSLLSYIIDELFDNEILARLFIASRIQGLTGNANSENVYNPDGTTSYVINVNDVLYSYTPFEEKKKQKAIIMVGIPGSGKTYLAEKIKSDLQNTKIISTNKIREEMFGDASNNKHNDEVFDKAHKMFGLYLNAGYNVIFDATSIKKEYRKKILDHIPKDKIDNVETICLHLITPVKICKRRMSWRERKVPFYIIDSMNDRLERPKTSEGFDSVATIYNA